VFTDWLFKNTPAHIGGLHKSDTNVESRIILSFVREDENEEEYVRYRQQQLAK